MRFRARLATAALAASACAVQPPPGEPAPNAQRAPDRSERESTTGASEDSSEPKPAPVPKPSPQTLRALEARGRFLADYDRVAWVASDRLQAMKPDLRRLGLFFAVRLGQHWYVNFGKVSHDLEGSSFECAYTFWAPLDHPEQVEYLPGGLTEDLQANPTAVLAAALAVDAAMSAATELAIAPRYNNYVYPEADGTFTVYFMPAQLEPRVVLLGADFWVHVSAEAQVLDKRRLHKGLIEFKLDDVDGDGGQLHSTLHSHILTELPTETDIAALLIHPELKALTIVGKTWISEVEASGQIQILRRAEP